MSFDNAEGDAILRRFPARLDALAGALGFASEALLRHGLTPTQAARGALILEEVFCNSVQHGYASTSDDAPAIWIGVDAGLLLYQDAAPPFNPLVDGPAPPDPSLPLEQRQPGGMGLVLIRHLATTIRYHHDGERNCIVMSLRA